MGAPLRADAHGSFTPASHPGQLAAQTEGGKRRLGRYVLHPASCAARGRRGEAVRRRFRTASSSGSNGILWDRTELTWPRECTRTLLTIPDDPQCLPRRTRPHRSLLVLRPPTPPTSAVRPRQPSASPSTSTRSRPWPTRSTLAAARTACRAPRLAATSASSGSLRRRLRRIRRLARTRCHLSARKRGAIPHAGSAKTPGRALRNGIRQTCVRPPCRRQSRAAAQRRRVQRDERMLEGERMRRRSSRHAEAGSRTLRRGRRPGRGRLLARPRFPPCRPRPRPPLARCTLRRRSSRATRPPSSRTLRHAPPPPVPLASTRPLRRSSIPAQPCSATTTPTMDTLPHSTRTPSPSRPRKMPGQARSSPPVLPLRSPPSSPRSRPAPRASRLSPPPLLQQVAGQAACARAA